MVVIYARIIKIELLTTTPQGLNRKCLGYIFLSSHFFLSTYQTLSIHLSLPRFQVFKIYIDTLRSIGCLFRLSTP